MIQRSPPRDVVTMVIDATSCGVTLNLDVMVCCDVLTFSVSVTPISPGRNGHTATFTSMPLYCTTIVAQRNLDTG
jgi:hypothetical protein